MVRALRSPAAFFTLSALTVVAVANAFLRSRAYATNADLVTWGVTFDLTITIPLLFWLFVVRPGNARPLMIAPLFIACLGLAAALVPPNGFLRQLHLLAAPLEAVMLFLVARRVARLRHRPIASDPYERIETVVRELFGNERVAAIVTSEITILYYGLLSWREKPVRNERTFTVHERSGWNTILVCIFVLLAAESLGMHLLLLTIWGPIAAWVWTAFDVYAALWLLGDYRALVLRPSTIDDDAIRIRFGLRWTVTIARENIASIDPVTSEADWKRRDVLKVAILDEPRWLIRLREPMVAYGAAGLRKTITAVAVLPDGDMSEWRVASSE